MDGPNGVKFGQILEQPKSLIRERQRLQNFVRMHISSTSLYLISHEAQSYEI